MPSTPDARYVPRNYCDRPLEFGKSPDVRFGPLEKDRVDVARTFAERRRQLDNVSSVYASQVQHEHVLVILRLLDKREMSLGAYANLVGESYERIRGVMAGTRVMRLDDFDRADHVLGYVHYLVSEMPASRRQESCRRLPMRFSPNRRLLGESDEPMSAEPADPSARADRKTKQFWGA